MISVRRFVLRVGVLCALLVGVFATHLAVSKPRLPFVVLASIDRAFATEPLSLEDVLDHLEAELMVAGDAATQALDAQLAQLETLPPERREAALLITRKHLELARAELAHAPTAEEYVEYDATCERLREVRRTLSGFVLDY
jgi:hypothetical protein